MSSAANAPHSASSPQRFAPARVPSRSRWLAMLGLLCAFGAPPLYLALMGNATARSSGWPLWLGFALALALGGIAVAQGGRWLARIAFGVALGITALFTFGFLVLLRLPPNTAPQVGGTLPALVLPDERNQPVALADVWRDGPLLLVLYRGSW
jgi:hypothetical protein